jgi:hypothetical protein
LHAECKCAPGPRLNFIAKDQEEKHKSRLKVVELVGEGSRVETFEHLEISQFGRKCKLRRRNNNH